MNINNIPSRLFVNNRTNFFSKMQKNSVAIFTANEAMPRNGDQFFPFRQQSDFFYLTGIEAENAFLILSPDNATPSYREMLFIEPYDAVKTTWQGEMLDNIQASIISGIQIVRSSADFYSILKDIVLSGINTIYLNTYEYSKYECNVRTIQDRFIAKVKEMFPLHHFERSAPILNQLRMVKSQDEIDIIKHACDITSQAFRRCLKTVKPGRYEYQIQAEIEYVFKLNNAGGHAYAPIIAGGKNGCCLHYSKNNDILNSDDLVLFDIGCEYHNYSSDLSRTIPVNGKFNSRQKECYNAVLRVMKEITKLYKVGETINEINLTTHKLMESEMIKLGLFTAEDVKRQNPNSPLYRKYLMHGMSHHIGLDVHDSVDKYMPFETGMILTCEPGIYIREEGIGIRIENDLLITEDEPINLFNDLPVEVEEIENEMNQQQ
jgi:Xaa-Pro aminopeptidase